MTTPKLHIRKPYDPSNPCQVIFDQPTRTKQSFKDECDINNIMQKYQRTGLINHLNKYGGTYDQLPAEVDYQSSLDSIMRAKELFSSLPSEIRTRFGNDPASFLKFVEDDTNLDEMVKMGLVSVNKDDPPTDDEPLKGPPSKKGTEGTEPDNEGARPSENPDK